MKRVAMIARALLILISILIPVFLRSKLYLLTSFFPIIASLLYLFSTLWHRIDETRTSLAVLPLVFQTYFVFAFFVEVASAFYPGLGFALYALTEVMLLLLFSFVSLFVMINLKEQKT